MEAVKAFSGNGMGERTVIEIKNGVARHPLWRMKEPINLEIKHVLLVQHYRRKKENEIYKNLCLTNDEKRSIIRFVRKNMHH